VPKLQRLYKQTQKKIDNSAKKMFIKNQKNPFLDITANHLMTKFCSSTSTGSGLE